MPEFFSRKLCMQIQLRSISAVCLLLYRNSIVVHILVIEFKFVLVSEFVSLNRYFFVMQMFFNPHYFCISCAYYLQKLAWITWCGVVMTTGG